MLLSLTILNGYVTVPEILWAVFGLYGLWIGRKNLHHAGVRKEIATKFRERFNGDALALTTMYVRIHSCLVLYSLVNVAVAGGSMLLPPVNPDIPITPSMVVVTVGLFLGQVLMITISQIVHHTMSQLEK